MSNQGSQKVYMQMSIAFRQSGIPISHWGHIFNLQCNSTSGLHAK